jgi:hypothetical protein
MIRFTLTRIEYTSAALPRRQQMCSALDHLFLNCGTTPTFEYTLVAAGLAALIVFLVRP